MQMNVAVLIRPNTNLTFTWGTYLHVVVFRHRKASMYICGIRESRNMHAVFGEVDSHRSSHALAHWNAACV
jgi:hypothetical protein